MKTYFLCRTEDVSKTSGTGNVAEIAEFDDKTVAVRWLASTNDTGVASTTIFNSLEDLLKVHGHEGRTVAQLVLDQDRSRRLERALDGAISLLRQHGIPVPEDLRAGN